MTEFININANLQDVFDGSLTTGDFDGDGDLDLLVAGAIGGADENGILIEGGVAKIYTNDGAGGFSEDTNANLTGVYDSSVATGDFDDDGDLDLLVTGYNAGNSIAKIYINDGSGGFSENTNNNLTSVGYSSVATGDFDDDGDLDLLITGRSGSAVDSKISKIYINDGSGGFSEDTNNNLTGVDEGSTATEDFDGDGDLDLLVTGFDNDGNIISKIYTNDGSGSFSEDTNNNLTGVSFSSVATGDFDGDNDIDLFLTGDGSRTGKFYTNDGSGSFSEDTEANPDGFGNIDGSVTTGDYDKDGDLDILITGLDDSRIAKIYANDGSGVFSEDINANLTGVTFSSSATGDFDGDTDLDLLITGLDDSGNPTSKVYRNETINIPIKFTEITDSNNPFDGVNGVHLPLQAKPSFADLDGDGDLDAFVGDFEGKINYFENTGSSSNPNFTPVTDSNNPLGSFDVGGTATPRFADLDGDGDLDAFVGNYPDGKINYFENTGNSNNPNFTPVTDSNNPFDGVNVDYDSTLDFADLDGDGDLDAFVGAFSGKLAYFENTGNSNNPNFSEVTGSNNPLGSFHIGYTWSTLSFADLEGDGDIDAFVGDFDGKINYFENTGNSNNPSFSEVTGSNNPLGRFDVGYLAGPSFADLDADGDLDAFVGNQDGKINYFQNITPTPSYSFTEITDSNNPFDSASVVDYATPSFADLDGDGDLDAFVGDGYGNINYFENTGDSSNPNFSEVTDSNNPFSSFDVGTRSAPTFADLDNDGDLDAFVGKYGNPIDYFENTGTSSNPNFSAATPFDDIDLGYFTKLSFADLDGDGDLDAFVGDGYGKINYFENTGSSNNLNFSPVTDSNNPFDGINVDGFAAPSFADLDRDGDLDAFVGNQDGNINYFENRGNSNNPNFSEVTGSNNPLGSFDVGINAAPSFADLDGDGDLDTFVGNGAGNINYFQNLTPSYNVRVEAEDYVNYYDTTAGNRGGAYRDDDVDLQATSDMEGGFNVGWIASGEWLTYDVDVPQTGWYEIQARVASAVNQPHNLDLALDGQSTSLNFDGTGGWQSWEDVSGDNLNLTAGSHELRLDLGTSSFNLNYIDIDLVPLESIRVEAEDYVNYYDTTTGNRGGAYRDDDVDLQATSDMEGGFNVGWIASGEWLTYDLDVPQTGWYEIQARVASNVDTQLHELDISLDGQSTSLNFSGTGGWQSWEDVSGGSLNLTAGSHELRLDMGTSSFNLNYIDLVPLESI